MLLKLYYILFNNSFSFSSTAELSADSSAAIDLTLQMLHSYERPIFVGKFCKQSLRSSYHTCFLVTIFLSIFNLLLTSFCKFSAFFSINKL